MALLDWWRAAARHKWRLGHGAPANPVPAPTCLVMDEVQRPLWVLRNGGWAFVWSPSEGPRAWGLLAWTDQSEAQRRQEQAIAQGVEVVPELMATDRQGVRDIARELGLPRCWIDGGDGGMEEVYV